MNVVRDVVEESKSHNGDDGQSTSLSSVRMNSASNGGEGSSSCSNTEFEQSRSGVVRDSRNAASGFSRSPSSMPAVIRSTSTQNGNSFVEDDADVDVSEAGVIAAPPAGLNTETNSTSMESTSPAEIPVEDAVGDGYGTGVACSAGLNISDDRDDDHDDDDDEDESEYEYEDEDDAAFSGFIVQNSPLPSYSRSAEEDNSTSNGDAAASPARIRDDESVSNSVSAAEPARKSKWREPSRQAVSMSLRAEEEKTGSKRRLAQDLYRIMNQEHDEAGFSIGPQSEDSMDKWTIKLFKFDEDSNLAKDMLVLGDDHVELEMSFPAQYPFEPPFVRVVRPRFKRQTGFVMNGALCMELLTKDGWNPVNDIESVIVSIRSLLVVGDGRLQAAYDMAETKYQARLKAAQEGGDPTPRKRPRISDSADDSTGRPAQDEAGSYSLAEAHAAYSHLSDYHKKKGWDSSGWWARKG